MWGGKRYPESQLTELILHRKEGMTISCFKKLKFVSLSRIELLLNQETTSGGQIDENCVAIDSRQHMPETELTAPYDLESTVSNGSSMGEYGSCSSPSDWGTPSYQRAISVKLEHVDLPGWIMDDDLERTGSQK